MKRVIKTVVISVVLIVIAATIIAIGMYSNGYECFASRYVSVNGEVLNYGGSFVLPANSDTVFKVKSAGFENTTWEYTVKILTNKNAGIEFTVNDESYKYVELDVTAYFDIEYTEDSFTIKQGDYSVENILKTKYGAGVKVTKESGEPYKLIISDKNNVGLLLNFTFMQIKVSPDKVVI